MVLVFSARGFRPGSVYKGFAKGYDRGGGRGLWWRQSLRRSNNWKSTKIWLAPGEEAEPDPRNIVGGALQPCSFLPLTGYRRDGFCQSCDEDRGQHTVCIRCTQKFLDFSKRAGNDLSTPFPEYGFPGLQEGDAWCLCAERWLQAFQYSSAPDVIVAATHSKALDIVSLSQLLKHASNEPIGDDEMQ